MLEAYSLNVTVPADSAVPFNNVTIRKGCTAELNGVSVTFNSTVLIHTPICQEES